LKTSKRTESKNAEKRKQAENQNKITKGEKKATLFQIKILKKSIQFKD